MTRRFKTYILLIEFDPAKPFSLLVIIHPCAFRFCCKNAILNFYPSIYEA